MFYTLDNALPNNDKDAVWFYEIVSTSANAFKLSRRTWISSFSENHANTMNTTYHDEYHTYDEFLESSSEIDFRHMHWRYVQSKIWI